MARHVALVSLAVASLTVGVFALTRGSSEVARAGPVATPVDGRQLFLSDCAVCHGARGQGTAKAPALRDVGLAAVDFMIRTGRMPLQQPDQTLERRTPRYSEAEIRALDAYAAGFVSGPPIPSVSLDHTSVSAGQRQYRDQCAACHQAAGSGGALAYGKAAPPLTKATPREVVEAMRIGPGTMPRFDPSVLSPEVAADVAAYVAYLHHPQDPGGLPLAHLGPVPEGLVAWVIGLGGLLIVARLLGVRVHRPDR